MKLLFDLFITFAKLGAVTFGGGYAMLPLIERVSVEKKKWISKEDMVNIDILQNSIYEINIKETNIIKQNTIESIKGFRFSDVIHKYVEQFLSELLEYANEKVNPWVYGIAIPSAFLMSLFMIISISTYRFLKVCIEAD